MSSSLDVSKRQLQEEIEALRRTLDSPFAASHSSAARGLSPSRYASPARAYTPVRSPPRGSPVRSPTRPAAVPPLPMSTGYTSVSANLERAEREVEDLGRRMKEVEREVREGGSPSVLRSPGRGGTTEYVVVRDPPVVPYRQPLVEEELRLEVDAKEKVIQTLRRELSTTKGSLETRCSGLEAALARSEESFRIMESEVVQLRLDKRNLTDRFEREAVHGREVLDRLGDEGARASVRERELDHALGAAREENVTLASELGRERALCGELRRERDAVEVRYVEARKDADTLMEENGSLRKFNKQLADKVERDRVRLARMESEWAAREAENDRKLEVLRSEVENRIRRVRAQMEERAASLEARCREVQGHLSHARRKVDEYKKKLARATATIEELEARERSRSVPPAVDSELEKKVRDLERKLEQAKKKIEDLASRPPVVPLPPPPQPLPQPNQVISVHGTGSQERIAYLEMELENEKLRRELQDNKMSKAHADLWMAHELKAKEQMRDMVAEMRELEGLQTRMAERTVQSHEQVMRELRQSRDAMQRELEQLRLESQAAAETLSASPLRQPVPTVSSPDVRNLELKVAELARREEHLEQALHQQELREVVDLRDTNRRLFAELEAERKRWNEDLAQFKGTARAATSPYAGTKEVHVTSHGDILTRCLRCQELFTLGKDRQHNECGYHPGTLRNDGYSCCGVQPEAGVRATFCTFGPHIVS